MTDDPRTITDRLATIEAQLAEILNYLRPDPTPPQFSQMLGGQHFAPFTHNGGARTYSANGSQELTVVVGKDGRLIVDRRGSKG